MPNPVADINPADEVVRVIQELQEVGPQPNIIQKVLFEAIAGKLEQSFGTDPDDEMAELLAEASTVGSVALISVLNMVLDGLIFSSETMGELSPAERFTVLLNSLATVEAELEEDEDEEEFDPSDPEVTLDELLESFAAIFGGAEEAQIGADSR